MRRPRTIDAPPATSDIERAARDLEYEAPQDILAWAVQRFPKLVLSCSFGGPTGMVILDMLMAIDSAIPVCCLDTGLLFPQTYELLDRAAARYGITPICILPDLSIAEQERNYGARLWERDPDRCCELRKVEPHRKFLSRYDAWITGLRRDQSVTRAHTPVIEWDKRFGLVKINPLATWNESMTWAYLLEHDVPVNELHAQGYPSAGCVACTKPVLAEADLRAGRWDGHDKIECGLHGAD